MPKGRGRAKRDRGDGATGKRRQPRRGADLAPAPDRQAAKIVAELAREARGRFLEVEDGLDAQLWASSLVAMWDFGPLADVDTDEVFGLGLVAELERSADAGSLAALRAITAVASERFDAAARAAADRLAAAGVSEPCWVAELDAPARAARRMFDPVFDDAANVFIEFERRGGEPYTIAVLIDHNLGEIAKEVLVAGPLAEVEELFAAIPDEVRGEGGIAFDDLDPELAGALIVAALARTEITLDAPVGEDFSNLRAIAGAHARRLAGAVELDEEEEEVPVAAREAACDGFFESPEGRRFADDSDAEDLVWLAIDFGCDYVGGVSRPLRWSPTVVELFLTWFVPAKVVRDRAFLERVPELLELWVRYAGTARGLSEAAVASAAAAVGEFAPDMLELADDHESWGPGKTLGMAALEAGIDISDEQQLGAFIESWNAQRAA